jgi:hypothetical protein
MSHSYPKQLYYGQLLVETIYKPTDFAKEVANAVLIQAEQNGKKVDYCPGQNSFVHHVKDGMHFMLFNGDLEGYLHIPAEDIHSLHVSFRLADADDKSENVRHKLDLLPAYVLTLSVASSTAGELGDKSFWEQLGNNLWTGITTPTTERAGDQGLRIAIVYGDSSSYQLIFQDSSE